MNNYVKPLIISNARKWKHQEGGIIEQETYKLTKSLDDNTYQPTIDDLVNFTKSFETYKGEPYILKTITGVNQTLAGYGSANPKIIKLAQEGKLTEQVASQEVKRKLQEELDNWNKLVPNFKNLPKGVQLALADTSYNGKGVSGTIKGSPNLMKAINSGETNPEEIVKHLDHSKSANGWLGVRSAARRAMALGKYDWNWNKVDKYGRQIDPSKYKGPKDWMSSPYFGVYKLGGKLWNNLN